MRVRGRGFWTGIRGGGPINKPPGHYRDEKGNEYYWDGRTRSYIPDNTIGRFLEGMNRATPVFVWGYVAVLAIPVLLLLVLFLFTQPALLLLIPIIGGCGLVLFIDNQRRQADELRIENQKKAQAEARERERWKRREGQKEKVDPRIEANNRQVEEIDEQISALLAEGIRENFVGKTHSDFLPREDHPVDELFGGMNDEEARRHGRYITLNTELKKLRPSRFPKR